MKIKTGIMGLDKMLNGGIPANHTVALCGGPGTGKTLMGFQYLYYGAENGEPGLFITLVESEDSLIKNLKSTFDWNDIDKLISESKIKIVKPKSISITEIVNLIESNLNDGIKRIVIDSATVLRLGFNNALEYRQTIQEFITLISGLNCTTIMTYELPYFGRNELRFGTEQFLVDGLIMLYNLERREKRVRALEVLKMRGTSYIENLVPFKITTSGIEVYMSEKVF